MPRVKFVASVPAPASAPAPAPASTAVLQENAGKKFRLPASKPTNTAAAAATAAAPENAVVAGSSPAAAAAFDCRPPARLAAAAAAETTRRHCPLNHVTYVLPQRPADPRGGEQRHSGGLSPSKQSC